FHGTYSTNFFDSAPSTPLYEYNQIAYRLDLSTIPQLSADVAEADFNADGLVDQYDLERWTAAFGNGLADGSHFLLWQQQLGTNRGLPALFSPAIEVPEPATATLCFFCIMITVCRNHYGLQKQIYTQLDRSNAIIPAFYPI
ncbi:MAG: hypothetical protein ABGX16_26350, partial [Pirellulales bacterium]